MICSIIDSTIDTSIWRKINHYHYPIDLKKKIIRKYNPSVWPFSTLICICGGWWLRKLVHAFFYKLQFFSTQPQCCLTFSWIKFQMLLRFCLIHKSIIILGDFLYLLYLCLCLYLGLFLSYLCNLCFIFIFIFMMISRIILSIQTYMFFCLYFRVCPIIFGW